MTHEVFELAGDEMQLFESYPFSIITDCDGTELVYIRSRVSDDTLCDVIFCSKCLYQYAKWTQHALEQWVFGYCASVLERSVASIQHTPHIMLAQLDISNFSYRVNGLKKLDL